jgi:RHS repeat-associated protein
MATYAFDGSRWTWSEQHLYGAERLGVIDIPEGVVCDDESSTTTTTNEWSGYLEHDDCPNTNPLHHYHHFAGSRRYEITNHTSTTLSDHLGNVMVVINELPIIDASLSFQTADAVTERSRSVVSATDYYPFGLQMAERVYEAGRYAFGFNGKINDEEILSNGRWQDYGFRAYRSDIGRFVSVDPLAGNNINQSVYASFDDCPILKIDPDGKDAIISVDLNNCTINVSTTLYYCTGPDEGFPKDLVGTPRNISNASQTNLRNDWNGLHKVTIDGVEFTVNVSVKLVEVESFADAKKKQSENPGSNLAIFAEKGSTKTNSGAFMDDALAYIYLPQQFNLDTPKDGLTFSHEIAHLFGLLHDFVIKSHEKPSETSPRPNQKINSITSYEWFKRGIQSADFVNMLKPAVDFAKTINPNGSTDLVLESGTTRNKLSVASDSNKSTTYKPLGVQ